MEVPQSQQSPIRRRHLRTLLLRPQSPLSSPFPPITACPSGPQRASHTVVADLDGTLLLGRSAFPYFFLVAFEAGSYLRAWLLLLATPLIAFLYYFVRESFGIQLMMFLAFCGLPLRDIEAVARAVVPKFYQEDLHPTTWPVFASFGTRVVLTANPRVMVEPFLKEVLGVDEVLGTEIEVTNGGRATGFAKKPQGILVGKQKEEALKRWIVEREEKGAEENGVWRPDVGMGDRETDFGFMAMCKEGYIVPKTNTNPMKKNDLPKQLIFHDGRLVQRPTPVTALAVLLWIPFGILLALVRVGCGICLPVHFLPAFYKLTGIQLRVTGPVPPPPQATDAAGVLYVCNHRTLIDPVVISIALGRPVPAVTYSISKVSETLSPVKTIGLCRDRAKDSKKMRKVLEKGELTLCPEGTTCREPFLLRFSALFAEVSDRIVPVAVSTKMTMFHGTTARGNKVMDPFFAYMNPRPVYEVQFLNELPRELTCASGKSSFEVANCIQRLLAEALGYECTDLTRKDKYRLLVGNDGTVPVAAKSR